MRRWLPTALIPVAFVAGLTVSAKAPTGAVVSTADAPTRVAPSGKASVTLFTPHDTEGNAFFALLHLDGGAKVPLHKDESEELIYILEGGGEIWIDGAAHTVGPGHAVIMPPNAEVRFEGGAAPTKVLQVFAPATSAAKYAGWTTQ